MQVKSVLTLATGLFAPAAMSFLIPPEMGLDDTEPLALDISWGPPRQTIDLDCPGCTIRVGDIVSMSAKNHLQLTFSVEGDETNGNRLVVNGFELYPDPNPWEGGLTAMQQLDVSLKDLGDFEEDTQPENAMDDYSVEVPVGYTLAVYNGPSDVTQQMRLVNVDLTITEVAGDRVDGLPTLKVQLINQNGLLYIATIAKVQNTSGGQQEDCQDMWCMAKNMLDKSFGKLKSGCKGMMAHHGDGHRRPHHGFHSHEHGGKGHMHHGHHMPEERPAMPHHESHSVLGMMANLLEHFILPLLVGIMAGVAVGSVAMLVVSYIVRFFLYVSGKQTTASRCPFQRRRAEDVEVIIVEEEKAGLMENQEDGEVQDAPPKYSDDGTPRV